MNPADIAVQAGLVLVCPVATWLSQSAVERTRRWACIVGLLFNQPLWLFMTWHAGQWGAFVSCILYTASWARGLWTYWVKPWRVGHDRHRAPNYKTLQGAYLHWSTGDLVGLCVIAAAMLFTLEHGLIWLWRVLKPLLHAATAP